MSSGMSVLIVDDEAPIRRFLRAGLKGHGYEVREAGDARTALEEIIQHKPDLVILDLGLPDRDGLELIREVREWSSIPIVVLSAREREQEKIAALDAGADDYLVKPFGIGELLARLRVALRHSPNPPDEPVFTVGELKVDSVHRRVTLSGREIKLTPTEYTILKYLVAHAGKVVTHRQLLREVWGPQYVDEAHYVRVYVGQLRQKIEPDPARPHYLLTETGVGYRLHVDELS